MPRRLSIFDVEQKLYRKRLVLDDFVLSIPKNKDCLNWFITEQHVDRTVYVESTFRCNVELTSEVCDWCDETMNGFPTFEESSFLMTDDIYLLNTPYSSACESDTVELHFLSEAEAMLFKLRWF